MILFTVIAFLDPRKKKVWTGIVTKVHSHGIPGSEALERPSSSINCDGFEWPVEVHWFFERNESEGVYIYRFRWDFYWDLVGKQNFGDFVQIHEAPFLTMIEEDSEWTYRIHFCYLSRGDYTTFFCIISALPPISRSSKAKIRLQLRDPTCLRPNYLSWANET